MDIMRMREKLLQEGKSIYDLPLRVVDYSRVSTELIGQATSLVNQSTYYSQLIENNPNWTHVASYVDDGITGTRTKGRDDFNRMIKSGLRGDYDMIITKEVSRFARNSLDSIFYTRELLKNGVAVFFESDNINTIFPDAEFKLTIMASLAQEESRKTSQRVRWAKKRMIENGQIILPYNMHGYTMEDGKVVIVEEEAEMIRKIFELYLKGLGFRKIGQELAKLGYTNSNGNPYGYSSLRGILTNPRYKGFFTGGMTEKESFMSTKVIHKDPDDWIMYPAPDIIPPIVTEEVWDKANEILEVKRDMVVLKHVTSYQNKYKYSGKIYCKEHDTAFHRTIYRYVKSEDRELYQCKVYRQKGKEACNTPLIYTKELDAMLACIFKTIFQMKDEVMNIVLDIISKNLNSTDFIKDITRVNTEIDKLNKRKDKLLDLVVNDLISKEEFKKRNVEFNENLELLNLELEKYESLRKAKLDTVDQMKMLEEFLKRDFDFDKEMPEELVDAFVDRIYISAGEVENLIKLDLRLKTGEEYPIYYRRDLSLSLATHIDRDKMTFTLPRVQNNQKAPDIKVIVENITLRIAV